MVCKVLAAVSNERMASAVFAALCQGRQRPVHLPLLPPCSPPAPLSSPPPSLAKNPLVASRPRTSTRGLTERKPGGTPLETSSM